jgi:ribonucleoside-diphosphate reductase alpha chain
MYEAGTPGEIFVVMAKEGSTISGLMDSFATMTSLALQHGVPLQLLVDKFTHTRFEPSGFTKNPEIPMAKSIMDYIFKWLAIKFLSRQSQEDAGVILRDEVSNLSTPSTSEDAPPTTNAVGNVVPLNREDEKFVNRLKTSPEASAEKKVGFTPPKEKTAAFLYQQDAPSCSECGSIMVRNGACYKCLNCGSTSGCS